MKKLNSTLLILFALLFSNKTMAYTTASQEEVKINNQISQVAPVSDPGPLNGPNDPADPNAPIDSNLYVLFFAAIVYGFYQRKHLKSIEVRG